MSPSLPLFSSTANTSLSYPAFICRLGLSSLISATISISRYYVLFSFLSFSEHLTPDDSEIPIFKVY